MTREELNDPWPKQDMLYSVKKDVDRVKRNNLVLIAYASSEGSGEPAHPRSLARTFAARSYKQWIKRNLQTESQIPSPSEWLGMRSWNLSWRNTRRHKFAWRGSCRVVNLLSSLNCLLLLKLWILCDFNSRVMRYVCKKLPNPENIKIWKKVSFKLLIKTFLLCLKLTFFHTLIFSGFCFWTGVRCYPTTKITWNS